MRKLSLTILLLSWATLVVHVIHYYPKLPETVACHFGADGLPNGWMAKPYYAAFTLGIGTFFVVIGLAVPWLTRQLPAEMINLPNKEYWLTPERRAATARAMSHWLRVVFAATLLLFLDMNHQAMRANLGLADRLTHPWLSLALFVAFTAVAMICLYRRFRLPKDNANSVR
jgi:uncharacterized membrane protein